MGENLNSHGKTEKDEQSKKERNKDAKERKK